MDRRRTLLTLLASAAGASVACWPTRGPARAATLAPRLLLKETARGLGAAPAAGATYAGLAQVGAASATQPVRDRWRWAPPAGLTVATPAGTHAAWQAPGPVAAAAPVAPTAGAGRADDRLLPPAAVCGALAGLFGPDGLTATLTRWNIDGRRVRLALADSTPCHVLGSDENASDHPASLWIEHQTFRVRRLVLPGPEAPQIDLFDWTGPVGRGALPARLVVRQRGRVLRDLWLASVEA